MYMEKDINYWSAKTKKPLISNKISGFFLVLNLKYLL